MRDLNKLAQRVHAANKQWWLDLDTGAPIERNQGELLMLVVSELAEAMEGERKNLMDDKLPHRKMAEVEMSDTVIRLLDFAGGFGYDIDVDRDALHYTIEKVPDNKGEALHSIVKEVGALSIDGIGHKRIIIAMAIYKCELYCKKFGYDLWGALEEKLEYNAQRADHKPEHRKGKHGKKF